MIYLRLSGGLGNQLYQLAAAALLAQCRQTAVTICADGLQSYKSPREPDSIKLLGDNDWLCVAPTNGSIHRWMCVYARAGRFLPWFSVNDRNFITRANLENGPQFAYVDGYFQHGWTTEKFLRATNMLRIRPVTARAADRLMSGEIAIHIRGGDFLTLPRYNIVQLGFYIEAVRQALADGFTTFAVLTDDPGYSAKICAALGVHFPDANFRILDRATTALEDFDTLRSASGRIIGNSTFAWWATALGDPFVPTWSPTMFTADAQRDFFLPNERQIERIV